MSLYPPGGIPAQGKIPLTLAPGPSTGIGANDSEGADPPLEFISKHLNPLIFLRMKIWRTSQDIELLCSCLSHLAPCPLLPINIPNPLLPPLILTRPTLRTTVSRIHWLKTYFLLQSTQGCGLLSSLLSWLGWRHLPLSLTHRSSWLSSILRNTNLPLWTTPTSPSLSTLFRCLALLRIPTTRYATTFNGVVQVSSSSRTTRLNGALKV